jgi:hypothetical protein
MSEKQAEETKLPEFKFSKEEREHASMVLGALAQLVNCTIKAPKFAGGGKEPVRVVGTTEISLYNDENEQRMLRGIMMRYLKMLL